MTNIINSEIIDGIINLNIMNKTTAKKTSASPPPLSIIILLLKKISNPDNVNSSGHITNCYAFGSIRLISSKSFP